MPSDSFILSFDTSAAHCAAALVSGAEVLAEGFRPMVKGQAEHLMPLISEIMEQAGQNLQAVDAIAVGTGPGNFTGTRISVSAARGLSVALRCPSFGITGFEALYAARPPDQGCCVTLLPASRDTVYVQAFDSDGQASMPGQIAKSGPFDDAAFAFPGLLIGEGAEDIATQLGPQWQTAPQVTANPAVLIARALQAKAPWPKEPVNRPKPLYLRPADAAPASDPPPVLLS